MQRTVQLLEWFLTIFCPLNNAYLLTDHSTGRKHNAPERIETLRGLKFIWTFVLHSDYFHKWHCLLCLLPVSALLYRIKSVLEVSDYIVDMLGSYGESYSCGSYACGEKLLLAHL